VIYIKNCVIDYVLDVITWSKFQKEIFRSCDFTGGGIYHFPIEFWMDLTTKTAQRCLRCLWCGRPLYSPVDCFSGL